MCKLQLEILSSLVARQRVVPVLNERQEYLFRVTCMQLAVRMLLCVENVLMFSILNWFTLEEAATLKLAPTIISMVISGNYSALVWLHMNII